MRPIKYWTLFLSKWPWFYYDFPWISRNLPFVFIKPPLGDSRLHTLPQILIYLLSMNVLLHLEQSSISSVGGYGFFYWKKFPYNTFFYHVGSHCDATRNIIFWSTRCRRESTIKTWITQQYRACVCPCWLWFITSPFNRTCPSVFEITRNGFNLIFGLYCIYNFLWTETYVDGRIMCQFLKSKLKSQWACSGFSGIIRI